MSLETSEILNLLQAADGKLQWQGDTVEILLIGGAAGMLTGQLPAHRITQDCDVMNIRPKQAQNAVLKAAHKVAKEKDLPEHWLSTQAMESLVALPDGWRSRRVLVARYKKLAVYAVSRLDLLVMKFYANRPQDRQDIIEMKPSSEEIEYIRRYLNMLRLPSRRADLDQIVCAFQLVDAIEDLFYGKK